MSSSSLRSRSVGRSSQKEAPEMWLEEDEHLQPDYSDIPKRPSKSLLTDRMGALHILLVVCLLVTIHQLVIYLDGRMPPITPASDSSQFSEPRARHWVQQLVSQGARPSGSYANEVHAKQLILNQLYKLQSDANPVHQLEIDTQHPSGCFQLGFMSDFTLCYQNVTNIVARFGPKREAEHSVLVNCHFDSIPSSPGASDDAVACAILLDTLYVLTQSNTPLKHHVIMLFNGAEENFLQASHGFITSHRWRHSVRAFINLEGAGTGGRELLFQTGPGNPWLIQTYIESAPHPHANVLAQEVFQLGVFPSDTDFRIFRDYGRIAGLDIAYVRNGYVYHTEFDQEHYITKGAIQRAGDNVLNVLIALVESPYLDRPSDYESGQWVFFDVVGMFTCIYSQTTGNVINVLTLAVLTLKLVGTVLSHHRHKRMFAKPCQLNDRNYSYSVWMLMLCTVLQLICLVVMVLLGWILNHLVAHLHLSLVWFAHPVLMLPLYIMPMLITACAIISLSSHLLRYRCEWQVLERCMFDVCQLLIGASLFSLIMFDSASGYLPSITLLILFARQPIQYLIGRLTSNHESNGNVVFVSWCICVSPVFVCGSYFALIVVEIFMPVMGRLGGVVNPELVVMVISVAIAFAILMFTVSLEANVVVSSAELRRLLIVMSGFVLIVWVVLSCTAMYNPFSCTDQSPTPRHSNRQTYNEKDRLIAEQNFLWFEVMDSRGAGDLPSEMVEGGTTPDCTNTPNEYCDLPFYGPTSDLFPSSHSLLVPSEPPPITEPLKMEMTEKVSHKAGHVKMSFNLTGWRFMKYCQENTAVSWKVSNHPHPKLFLYKSGSDHQSLHMTPQFGWKLKRWSFTKRLRSHGGDSNQTYFLFLASNQSHTQWTFYIEMQHVSLSTAREIDVFKPVIIFIFR